MLVDLSSIIATHNKRQIYTGDRKLGYGKAVNHYANLHNW